ncbi:MAG: O-methyltransferase [Bulleidia sp.]|nr:O-methyltransferase [Bulleidia sp.]
MKQLDEIEAQARKEHIPVMFDDGMEFLLSYLRDHEGIMQILECGTAVGWSSMKMASVRENITIDTLEINPGLYAQAKHNIEEAGLSDRIFCHLCDAVDYRTAKTYDLFFIDAAKSQYRRYVEHFYPNSCKGSVFIFDNLNFHGIVDHPELSENRSTLQMTRKIHAFRDWLMKDERFETEFHPEVGDGVAVSIRIK